MSRDGQANLQRKKITESTVNLRRERWNGARLMLGQLQVIGAAATLFLFLTQGLSEIAEWSLALTMVLSLTSVLLFKVLKVQRG